MEKIFSIIIPVYNVEKYLNECIDSILNQDFENYEIICVDDGSTDNSYSILESYGDNEKLKIIKQKNKGQSSARNIALEMAQGKYIWFIDSDDKISKDSLSILYEKISYKDYDIVFFNAINFFETNFLEKKGWREYVRKNIMEEVNAKSFFELEMKDNNLFVQPGMYIYKREGYKNLRFINGILHEDNPFFAELIWSEPDAICSIIKEGLYLRRIREDSTMTKNKNMNHYNGYKESINKLVSLKNENKIKNYSYDKFIIRLAYGCVSTALSIKKPITDLNIRKDIFKYLFLHGKSAKSYIAFILPEVLIIKHFIKKLTRKI